MEEWIRKKLAELGNKEPESLFELQIEGVQSAKVEGLSERFQALASLSFINCGLNTLDGLPKLPALTTLLLGDNKLKSEAETGRICSQCPRIRNLSLVGNRFESVEELKPFVELRDLRSLDLFNCPLTKSNGYRDELWELLPQMEVLDGFDRQGKEVPLPGEEDDEDEEEEDDEEDVEDEDDQGPGLSYLQQELGDSDDDQEADYDPEGEVGPASDDDIIIEDDDSDDDYELDKSTGDVVESNSSKDVPPAKRQRLEEPTEGEP